MFTGSFPCTWLGELLPCATPFADHRDHPLQVPTNWAVSQNLNNPKSEHSTLCSEPSVVPTSLSSSQHPHRGREVSPVWSSRPSLYVHDLLTPKCRGPTQPLGHSVCCWLCRRLRSLLPRFLLGCHFLCGFPALPVESCCSFCLFPGTSCPPSMIYFPMKVFTI